MSHPIDSPQEFSSLSSQTLGKVGQVLKIYSDGDIRVAIAGQHWTFNPAVLVKESPTAIPSGPLASPHAKQTTAHGELQGILQPSPSSTSSSKSQRQHQRRSSAEERRNVPNSQREIGKT